MKTIYMNYILCFADPKSRPAAHRDLLLQIEAHKALLERTDITSLLEKAFDFSTRYKKAWFWKKAEVLTAEIKAVLL
jgi:hypothetical protein